MTPSTTGMTLSRRIEVIEIARDRRSAKVSDLRPTPFKPAWIRRMDERGLTPLDRTSDVYVSGAWTPADRDGAA